MALPTENTPVAKSLHTLKVIQQVAELIIARTAGPIASDTAIDEAMAALGLAGRPDPYGLAERACANLAAARLAAKQEA